MTEAVSSQRLWRGVAVALITLFNKMGAVDLAGTVAHAQRLVAAGVRAVLVAGSTGEAEALTDAERVDLVAAVREALPQDVPVIAGAGGAWTKDTVERVNAAIGAGADAVLVAPPRRVADVVAFYQSVAAAAGSVPVLAYHFPGVAGGAVPVEALPKLPVAGLKDSTGDAERLLQELAVWSGWTYVGSSALVTLAGVLGAAGAILAVANAYPRECAAAFAGDGAAQRWLLDAHLAARTDLPHGIKALVAKQFGTSTAARLG